MEVQEALWALEREIWQLWKNQKATNNGFVALDIGWRWVIFQVKTRGRRYKGRGATQEPGHCGLHLGAISVPTRNQPTHQGRTWKHKPVGRVYRGEEGRRWLGSPEVLPYHSWAPLSTADIWTQGGQGSPSQWEGEATEPGKETGQNWDRLRWTE